MDPLPAVLGRKGDLLYDINLFKKIDMGTLGII